MNELYPRPSGSINEERSRTSTVARVAQSVVLVGGGGNPGVLHCQLAIHCRYLIVVAGIGYELIGRPFDVIRREWHIYTVTQSINGTSCPPSHIPQVVLQTLRGQGMRALFRPVTHTPSTSDSIAERGQQRWQRRLYPVLRTIARVGPWGIGFLVWEAFGSGIQ